MLDDFGALGDLGVAVSLMNRLVTVNWDQIAAQVPPAWLPQEAAGSRARHRAIVEYGCGHYGCVAPTQDENVVVKVTTDPTEVAFIKVAMSFGEWPDGIVRYHKLMPIEGSYRGRRAYILWRETAYNVGVGAWQSREAVGGDMYRYRARMKFSERLLHFKDHADAVREILQRSSTPDAALEAARHYEDWAWQNVSFDDAVSGPWGYGPRSQDFLRRLRGPQRLAARLRAAAITAEIIANEPEGYLVGQALDFYMERGLLLCDVHLNNIGEVEREDYKERILVITDPGHVLAIK